MTHSNLSRVKKIVTYAALSLVTVLMVLPLIWLLSASFQGQGQIFQVPFHWIPQELHLENYTDAWKLAHMDTAFFSSACISLIYIVCHVCFCTIIGYVFAKYKFKGKNFFFGLVLVTMMIPQELTYFPVYGLVRNMHLINSYVGVVLPLMVSGFGVFLMKQFSAYIPNEILEAAKIDGCGNFKSFLKVGVPLLKPAASTLVILAFSFIWDEFPWSRMVLNTPKKMSIPIMLVSLASSSNNEVKITALLAASVLAMLPVVILFIIFQRQFIESITQSGVKG